MISCSHNNHPFDSRHVQENWWPRELKCLIIGENPGSSTSAYFYDPIPKSKRDSIRVRSQLLKMLSQIGIISSPDLGAFKSAGLVFDHGIRCPLDSKPEIARQRRLAATFRSPLAHEAVYLQPFIEQAHKVWIMGHVARDAVVFAMNELEPEIRDRLNGSLTPPFVYSKFFVSRYLTRCPRKDWNMIFEQFRKFWSNA